MNISFFFTVTSDNYNMFFSDLNLYLQNSALKVSSSWISSNCKSIQLFIVSTGLYSNVAIKFRNAWDRKKHPSFIVTNVAILKRCNIKGHLKSILRLDVKVLNPLFLKTGVNELLLPDTRLSCTAFITMSQNNQYWSNFQCVRERTCIPVIRAECSAVLRVTWFFKNQYNMMIWCSRNTNYYQCWNQLCCFIFMWKPSGFFDEQKVQKNNLYFK